jgi:hypothetical protein
MEHCMGSGVRTTKPDDGATNGAKLQKADYEGPMAASSGYIEGRISLSMRVPGGYGSKTADSSSSGGGGPRPSQGNGRVKEWLMCDMATPCSHESAESEKMDRKESMVVVASDLETLGVFGPMEVLK